jgi:acetyltransferase
MITSPCNNAVNDALCHYTRADLLVGNRLLDTRPMRQRRESSGLARAVIASFGAPFDVLIGTVCAPLLDQSLYEDFVAQCTANDLRLRFGTPIRPDAASERLRKITLASALSLAALGEGGVLWALAQVVTIAPGIGEIGMIVRSDRRRCGIGRGLLAALALEARAARMSALHGTVLAENAAMRGLAHKAGFTAFAAAGCAVELRLDFGSVFIS